jgi:hypothetical protein
MPLVRAQVTIPAVSGISEDSVVNTFHFTTTGTSEGLRAELSAALVDFYEDWDTFKSTDYTWASARVKYYNLDDPEPRVPLSDVGLALTSAPAGTPGPHEVSLCVSYKAEYVSGESAARRRGRIYCGPFHSAVLGTGGRPSSTLITALWTAGSGLLLASTTASDWAWIVYSPTSGQGYPVTGGWVDNEFDIQRRRGGKPTARTTF